MAAYRQLFRGYAWKHNAQLLVLLGSTYGIIGIPQVPNAWIWKCLLAQAGLQVKLPLIARRTLI